MIVKKEIQLIRNVKQRSDTILKVAQAIVEKQQGFFEYGDLAMQPLLLKEIADRVNLHESTISRVTNQKYLQSNRGTYSLDDVVCQVNGDTGTNYNFN